MILIIIWIIKWRRRRRESRVSLTVASDYDPEIAESLWDNANNQKNASTKSNERYLKRTAVMSTTLTKEIQSNPTMIKSIQKWFTKGFLLENFALFNIRILF